VEIDLVVVMFCTLISEKCVDARQESWRAIQQDGRRDSAADRLDVVTRACKIDLLASADSAGE